MLFALISCHTALVCLQRCTDIILGAAQIRREPPHRTDALPSFVMSFYRGVVAAMFRTASSPHGRSRSSREYAHHVGGKGSFAACTAEDKYFPPTVELSCAYRTGMHTSCRIEPYISYVYARSSIYLTLSANDLDTSAEHMPRIPWLFSWTYGGSLNGDTRSLTDTVSETFVITAAAVSVMLIRMPPHSELPNTTGMNTPYTSSASWLLPIGANYGYRSAIDHTSIYELIRFAHCRMAARVIM